MRGCQAHKRRRVAASVLAALVAAVAFAQSPQAELSVAASTRTPLPGEAVLLTVTTLEPVERITARVFRRVFAFYPTEQPNVWRVLLGIDLGTKPGEHDVDMEATRPSRSPVSASLRLTVRPKRFPVRRLTLPGAFVNPPTSALERIKRETRKMEDLFGRVTPDRLWEGPFVQPVPGVVVGTFGARSILNGQLRQPHAGTDFRGAEGTPIHAPNAGRVVLAEQMYFGGNMIVIDHGLGVFSQFAHLSRFETGVGDLVERGQVIGLVGATGRVTGPHLHWSVRIGTARVDPLSIVKVTESAGE